MKIYKRRVFNQVVPFIGSETIIVLHGARQVGKSYILFYLRDWLNEKSKKVFYYDLEYPDILEDFNKGVDIFLADLKGKGYQDGEEVFVLIDEIQYLDNPSSFLKIVADHYKSIRLIVSGSSTFDIKTKFTDSLSGRITPFEVFPLSFEEFLLFKQTGYVLSKVSSPSQVARLKELYKEFVIYGGYPRVVLESEEEKKKAYLLQVIDTYIRKDVRDLAQVEDIRKFNNMLYVLASQSGQLLDMGSLSRETTISFPTLQKYLTILEETYVIKLIRPYSKSPSVEISKNPKVFFYDSGLQSLLWFKNFQQTLLGNIFETNIFSELVKRYDRHMIHFWRTKQRQEIDFVVEKANGVCLPIEVKTNFQRYQQGAIDSFIKKYVTRDWKVVALEGKKTSEHFVFPWEV
ncbi:MAG TPA: ATP-binding protein [Candidatus Dormibacteraeota bacterium]|nr:ATP-binding protein [Candidatus Dormibacteraeota bacterium]